MEKVPDFIRWILVLPGFLLAVFILQALGKIMYSPGDDVSIGDITIIICEVVAVGGGIYVVRYLAPKYKFETTIAISIIEIVLIMICIYSAGIAGYSGWEFWKLVIVGTASIACAFIMSYQLKDGTDDI